MFLYEAVVIGEVLPHTQAIRQASGMLAIKEMSRVKP